MNDPEIIGRLPDHLAEAKKRMEAYSRSQLLKVIHADFSGHSERKATLLLLDELDKKDSDKKHKIILVIAAMTLFVALLTLVAQITDFSWNKFVSVLNATQMQQRLKPNTESQKPESKPVAPQQISPQPNKSPLKPDNSKTK